MAFNNAFSTCSPEFVVIANKLADIAGEIARSYFRNNVGLSFKTGQSPVTQADLAIEQALRDYLRQTVPEHAILGEEYGWQPTESTYTWVIDPIDGTASFACGKPTFCTLIALLQQTKPVLGLIDQPITQERWLGVQGLPTTLNGKPCTARADDKTHPLRLSCTTPEMFTSDQQRQIFSQVRKQASVVSYGGDGYAYGLLAAGHIDVIMEADLQFYDVAALIPIIEGAGGKISDWQGENLDVDHFNGFVLATNHPSLHARMLSAAN